MGFLASKASSQLQYLVGALGLTGPGEERMEVGGSFNLRSLGRIRPNFRSLNLKGKPQRHLMLALACCQSSLHCNYYCLLLLLELLQLLNYLFKLQVTIASSA